MCSLPVNSAISRLDIVIGLSIANAKDREEAARGNYVMAGNDTTIKAENDIRANAVNPLSAFMDIATAGIKGYGSFK